MAREDDYAEEGYPLAPLLLRISAAALDAAFASALFFLLAVFLYPHGGFPTLGKAIGMEEDWATIERYLTASGLMETEEADGILVPTQDIVSDDWEDYERSIRYYYFDYQLLEDPSLNPNPHPEWARERWYNVNVLGLPESESAVNESPLFSFGRDEEGNADLDVPAELKPGLFEEGEGGEPVLGEEAEKDLLSFYQEQYRIAQDRIVAEEFYQAPYSRYETGHFLTLGIALSVPVLVFYLAVPLLSRNGATFGKMIFRLGLLRYDGMPLPRLLIAPRAIPLLFSLLGALLANEVIVSGSILLLVFLISLTTGLLTPKRRALHDYCAMSVVTRSWASERAHEPDFLDIVRNGPPEKEDEGNGR